MKKWEKSFMFKQDSVVTKSVPNFGKSSQMSTVLTQQVPIMEILICNSKESTSITMKPPVDVMYQELSWWISNQEPWTLYELVPSVNFSDPITLSLVKQELVTIGLKVTTLKVLSWLTQYWMLLERKLKDVIAFKVSKSPIH